ncbi:MAG: response regulator [Planctomycetota bacterium]|nr:response regulator [Planctomycetota bacterium]
MTRKALVVDDSATMRQMISLTLEEQGFEVMQGVDGADALEQLNGSEVDVIITDLNMPVMDGMTFIRHVRSQPVHRFTPILILTTEGGIDRKLEGKEAGATGWIVKPFDPSRLVRVVHRVVA